MHLIGSFFQYNIMYVMYGSHKYSLVYKTERESRLTQVFYGILFIKKKHKQENNLVEKYPCVSQCVGNCGTVWYRGCKTVVCTALVASWLLETLHKSIHKDLFAGGSFVCL